MAKARPSGADLDPWSAKVYGPQQTLLASGESSSTPALILTTRIKSPRGLFTWERENQGRAFSVSDMAIEIRNEGGGNQLNSTMWIVHRNITYWIKGVLRTDWRAGTTIYQVTTSNDSESYAK